MVSHDAIDVGVPSFRCHVLAVLSKNSLAMTTNHVTKNSAYVFVNSACLD